MIVRMRQTYFSVTYFSVTYFSVTYFSVTYFSVTYFSVTYFSVTYFFCNIFFCNIFFCNIVFCNIVFCNIVFENLHASYMDHPLRGPPPSHQPQCPWCQLYLLPGPADGATGSTQHYGICPWQRGGGAQKQAVLYAGSSGGVFSLYLDVFLRIQERPMENIEENML